MPSREIALRTGVLRDTIKRYLREGSLSEWASVFGHAKMTTTLLDSLTYRCETGNDSCRFKASSETAKKKQKEKAALTPA
jgi:hypothetical protein